MLFITEKIWYFIWFFFSAILFTSPKNQINTFWYCSSKEVYHLSNPFKKAWKDVFEKIKGDNMRKRKILDPRICGYSIEVQVTWARDEGLLQARDNDRSGVEQKARKVQNTQCQVQGKWFYETGMLLAPFP